MGAASGEAQHTIWRWEGGREGGRWVRKSASRGGGEKRKGEEGRNEHGPHPYKGKTDTNEGGRERGRTDGNVPGI